MNLLSSNRNGIVRQLAALALGNLNNETAVEPLISALKDQDLNVKMYATEALRKCISEATIGKLGDFISSGGEEKSIYEVYKIWIQFRMEHAEKQRILTELA